MGKQIITAIFILIILVIMMVMLGYRDRSIPIQDKDYDKMTVYLNWDKEGPYIIRDKETIKNVIQTINTSPRKDITKISFEHGPEGRIIFEGKDGDYEIRFFTSGGSVVTEKYYILSTFNIQEIINREERE